MTHQNAPMSLVSPLPPGLVFFHSLLQLREENLNLEQGKQNCDILRARIQEATDILMRLREAKTALDSVDVEISERMALLQPMMSKLEQQVRAKRIGQEGLKELRRFKRDLDAIEVNHDHAGVCRACEQNKR